MIPVITLLAMTAVFAVGAGCAGANGRSQRRVPCSLMRVSLSDAPSTGRRDPRSTGFLPAADGA